MVAVILRRNPLYTGPVPDEPMGSLRVFGRVCGISVHSEVEDCSPAAGRIPGVPRADGGVSSAVVLGAASVT